MDWQPISELSLWDKINAAEVRMNPQLARLWEVIRISPQKWNQKSFGKSQDSYWVVGLIGTRAIWYNDIEDGFNVSRFTEFGMLDEYWCNQDELEWAIQAVLNVIESGQDVGGKCGPPIKVEYPSA